MTGQKVLGLPSGNTPKKITQLNISTTISVQLANFDMAPGE